MFLFEDLGTFVVAYFDDICIFSTNAAEHMQHVKIVLERLAKYGMHINKKSQWFKTEVDFLGHRITASGILPVSRKIDEVASFVSPINVSQLWGYLGLFSYYRKFIRKFAEKAAILYDLLKKNTKFVWSDKCEASFQYLKKALTNPELLIYPDFSNEFIIQSDASDVFVLGQEIDKLLRPIKFGGRSLGSSERNYSTTDRELLVAYYAVKSSEIYVLGHVFVLYVDHKPLLHIGNFKDIVRRRYNWISYSEEMNTRIRYIPGKNNIISDFITRNIADLEKLKVINCSLVELF